MSRHLAVVASLTIWGVLAAIAGTAQTPEDLQRPTANRYVAVGCVSRETSPAGRGAATAQPSFIITDNRGETPTVYRLDGDATELAFHLGHTVQVSGPLTAAPASATGPNAKALVLKVNALVYLSASCRFLK